MRRAVGAGAIVLGSVLPLIPLLLQAFARIWRYPSLLPADWTLRGFRVATDPGSEIVRGLLTSLGIGIAVSVISSGIGLAAGRALGLYRFPGRRLVQFLLLAPAIVPGLAVTLGIQIYFLRFGLADTVAGVVLVHLIPTIPYVTLVLTGAFSNLEVDYEAQARSLGAGPLRTFWHVTLPIVRPSLAVAAFFAFLISWSEYILTLVIGGGSVQTLPLLLFAYLGSSDLTLAAALAVVFVIPPVLLVTLTSRYLTGTTRAAVGFGRL
ncbi:MAG: ABC transporter permease [Actinomycetes bacterium]